MAFVLLSLVSGALYRGFSESAGSLASSIERYEAAEFARSQLDRLIAEHRVADMPESGTYANHWSWDLATRPANPLGPSRYLGLIDLWELELTVRNQAGKELSTMQTIIYERRL